MGTNSRTPGHWQELVTAAATDRHSGAAGVTRSAVEALLALVEENEDHGHATLARLVEQAVIEIAVGQRTMAPIMWLLSDALYAVETTDAAEGIQQVAEDWLRHLREAPAAIAKHVVGLFKKSVSVATISNSSAVSLSLLALHDNGRLGLVTCLESRPQYEGRALAASLGEAGIDVRLMVDAAMQEALASADVVLLGADAFTSAGSINKTGSASLAELATRRDVPVYVLADSRKEWPTELGTPPPIEAHPSSEVWDGAPENIRVVNAYFELIARRYITRLITEAGPAFPAEAGTLAAYRSPHTLIRKTLSNFV